jgi:HNH endonuclease
VAQRAGGCCEYCRSQERFAMQPFAAEHIEPRSRGGRTELQNLAWACQGCNNHKYNRSSARDPVTGERVPLFHPRSQRLSDHFAWDDDGTLILGLSPEGRATADALRLNRNGLVNLRRILSLVAEHPPKESGSQSP